MFLWPWIELIIFGKKSLNNLNQEVDKRKLEILFTKKLEFVKIQDIRKLMLQKRKLWHNIYFWTPMSHFGHIFFKLALFRNLYQSYGPLFTPKFSFRSLSWTNWHFFTKIYICIHIDKIYVRIVTQHFKDICTRVMALDLLQNFIYFQYLEKKWTEFHQILYMHSYW